MSSNEEESVFSRFVHALIERGFSVVPIAPGSKKPGVYSEADGWRGMPDWTRYAERMPTDIELEHWCKWPDAGIGLVLGKKWKIIALDKDYDVPGASDALESLIPYSPVAKRGEKGWTKFYRYNGERSCSFNVQGKRVLDVLADGRQTVIPPTAHPSGCNYVWITIDTLDNITNVDDLPQLPDHFLEQVEKVLAPYQTADDTKYQKKKIAPQEDDKPIVSNSVQGEYFRDINQTALSHLDDWVKKLIPTARPDGAGYRCIATWRLCTNHNVGINPRGIVDFGGDYGMTPIDLVMYANGLTFPKAVEILRSCLTLQNQPEAITFAAAKVAPAITPTVMPWMKPVVATNAIILPPNGTPEETVESVPAKAIPNFVLSPPGILLDMVNWINETAPKTQPELATGAAVALAATAMQRIYRSNFANFTSLYLVLIAKSTEGKEHPQNCVQKALTSAGLGHLIAGSGYTSSGAVFSALLRQPSHLAVIDEFGKLLKLSRAKGNSNGEAAFDKLIEAFGKLDGTMRPPVYSTMTLSPAQAGAAQPSDRLIHNPAITMLGATTPSTFYSSLTDDLVSDGFVGRLIVIESSQPRREARFIDAVDPPPRVLEWLQQVNAPAQRQGNLSDVTLAEIPAVTVEMKFSPACENLLRSFERELNVLKDRYEMDRLDVLLGRTMEKALRLSMIAAKARDVTTLKITVQDVEWAIEFVRHFDLEMVKSVRKNRFRNQTDQDTQKAISYIKSARSLLAENKVEGYTAALAAGAMPHALLLRRMHMKAREFSEIINTAVEAGVVTKCPGVPFGYAGDVYFVSED